MTSCVQIGRTYTLGIWRKHVEDGNCSVIKGADATVILLAIKRVDPGVWSTYEQNDKRGRYPTLASSTSAA